MIAQLLGSGGGYNHSLSWWGSNHCSLALHFSLWFKFYSNFLGRGSISIAHLLVLVGVTTAQFLGGDHVDFLVAPSHDKRS